MRILLNHFGWDKEKLLEAYYDGDQEQLFRDARVVNPTTSRTPIVVPSNGVEDCEICYMQKPSSVSLFLYLNFFIVDTNCLGSKM